MKTVNIRKAKAQLSQLIAKACLGEEVVIARRKRPVVKLVALPAPLAGPRIPGAWKGKVFCPPDVFDLLEDQEL